MSAPDLAHPHRFVVGVDGSNAARVALDWAARTAAAHGIRLKLVHVVETEAGRGIAPALQEGAEALLAASRRQAVAAGLPEDRIDASWSQGRPWEIMTAAADDPADLIVIGARGDGGYHRHLLGSTAADAARRMGDYGRLAVSVLALDQRTAAVLEADDLADRYQVIAPATDAWYDAWKAVLEADLVVVAARRGSVRVRRAERLADELIALGVEPRAVVITSR